MTSILSLHDIEQMALQHGLEVSVYRGEAGVSGGDLPRPKRISVRFKGECVPAWRTLMTHLTEAPVSIYGTRTVTGSGATDDQLLPGYRAILDEVNHARTQIGLDRVYG